MHGKKGQVDGYHCGPEMDFAETLVVHMPGPLGQPVIDGSHGTEDGTGIENVVEVGDHKVGVVVLKIGGNDREHQPREATNREQNLERDRKEHGCFKRHCAAPHRCGPVKDLHAGGYRDQHGTDHEGHLYPEGHANGEHVVAPDDVG